MHKARTSWPVQTRAAYIASIEYARRQYPRLSARSFCRAGEVLYATFSRWWAAWCRHDKKALVDRSRRPRRSPIFPVTPWISSAKLISSLAWE